MQMMKICTTILAVFWAISAFSQEEVVMPPIPDARAYHHDQIIRSMGLIAKLDHPSDSVFSITHQPLLDSAINRTLRIHITNLRAAIELNSGLNDNAKFTWLRG